MSFHIVSVDAPRADLSCRNGQFVCTSESGIKSLPLEDVASIVITSFSTRIHSHLFLEAARQGVALIFCERFRPVGILLPANRSTDTLLTRRHLHLPARTRQRLWLKTIDAKCHNQHAVASRIAPRTVATHRLERAAKARTARKEGGCARLFWEILSRELHLEGFARGRKLGGLNDLLNFGYAVLLSKVLQNLFAVGIDPTVGIAHALRERCAPLAYDLMEPFRPCVDWRVFQWVRQRPDDEVFQVSGAFRQWVTGFMLEKVDHFGVEMDLAACIESVIRGFRQAILSESSRRYRPWIWKNTKWDG